MKVTSMFRKEGIVTVAVATALSLFLVVSVVRASTTISTNITTDGTLSVTGASTLTGNVTAAGTLGVTGLTSMVQASSTRLSVHDTAYFGGSATTTINSAGNVSVAGTLAVTGATTLTGLANFVQASSTRLSVHDTAYFGGSATTTINSAGALSVAGLATMTNGYVSQASSTVVGALTTTGANAFGSTLGVTGLSTLTGYISTASSTVVGNLTVTGTFSPAQTSASSFTVTGLTTLGQASSTRLSVHDTAYFGGSATSTFNSAGALNLVAALTGTTGSFSSTLGVTGLTSLIQASSTRLSVHDTAYFGGSATSSFSSAGVLTLITPLAVASGGTGVTTSTGTGNTVLSASPTLSGTAVLAAANFSGLASTTQLRVGDDNVNTISGLIRGFCTIADISVAVASTTVQTACAGATGVTTSYAVFVQATSSMPAQIVIQSATSSAGAIQVRLLNTGINGGTPGAAAVSLNFWAVR